MKYIDTSTLAYPVLYETILRQFPNTSFPPEFVPPEPYAEVVESTKPTLDWRTQYAKEVTPVLIDGVWIQAWEVAELFATQEEKDASIAAAAYADTMNARAAAKAARATAVEQIKVTTAAGNTFDGDEVSQGRMARAIIALSTGLAPSVTWVLADNTSIEATAAELTEALVLSGQAQAAIWVI
jgi:hypothetical protein